jgi:hypothetical protein
MSSTYPDVWNDDHNPTYFVALKEDYRARDRDGYV